MIARHGAGLFAALALLAAVTACTTSGHPSAAVSSSPAAPSTPASSAPPSPVSSAAPTSAPPSTSPATSTSAPAPAVSSAAPHSTCTTVTVRVISGSASLGQEIAALQFTNAGTKTCVLAGFPTVTLLRNGQPIGHPSQPSSPTTSKRTLAPGDVAESVLHDYTQTCNAPLSDSVRVGVPGSTSTAIRPAVMRGCILRVDKLGPPQ
ncbi:MAG: DUF4232 domain-containing protein [Jatrophihabitans sp.]|uniref:DUF4232 domain-containing protein n=1 Tax=Jatrophihabitans sp. TaxID=1932789 RepID=UPI00391200C7